MTTRFPIIITLLAATSAAGLAVGAETPANATPEPTFTLNRGENLSTICAGIRQSGVNVSMTDCVSKILFANRQWFDDRFGYVWKDPAAVKLDSAVRLWAGVPYILPAELVAAKPAQAETAPQAAKGPTDAKPIHPGHFDPKGKPPSEFTMEVLRQSSKNLPFADKRDFDEQKKGLVAPMPDLKIMADAGHVVWDMERFQFLNEDREFDSIHPSLRRISVLNNNYGLYEVVCPGRSTRSAAWTSSDISFVRGKTGWIVFDPLVSAETVARVLGRVPEARRPGICPITAVIYSHSHADHWGGVRGLVDEADVRAGKVQIIASRDFMQHTIAENVFAGNAMNRRLFFQYGLLLPASPYGYVGQGLVRAVSAGSHWD